MKQLEVKSFDSPGRIDHQQVGKRYHIQEGGVANTECQRIDFYYFRVVEEHAHAGTGQQEGQDSHDGAHAQAN
ncbi:hypothetical protein D3C78_1563050 [compost metagenome]